MSQHDLQAALLEFLAEGERTPSDLLEQGATQRWKADEFEIREAIWQLLSSHQIELTPARRLRVASEHRVAV